MFYGREKQKKQIHNFLKANSGMVALIYGRRRIGKSELIKQCLFESAAESIYYECKQTTEMNNVESISELLSEKLGFSGLGFSGIEAVLKFAFEQAKEKNLILVLDEYPYLRECVKGLDSILQSLIDGYRNRSKLKLIVCGSYVETMRALLGGQNPLYGRVDLTIELKAMDYYESALFYRSFSDEDKVRLYSVFGGVPYYNRLIDNSKTVRENIIDLIASSDARLENEVSIYLNSEISKINNANAVFETLAKGFSKYKDILDQSHVSSAPTLVDVLDKLMRMDIVKKESPINDENNKRKAGYYICDNLSLFYYKYIYRNASRMQVMNPDVFYDRYIEEDFETQHVPKIFEDICRQYLIRLNQAAEMPVPFDKIGKYYYNNAGNKTNGEFDIVTHDDNGYIFYEAKFRKKPIDEKMMEQEIIQVNEAGLSCYKYGFFSRTGFAVPLQENVIGIELKELYD